MNVTLKHPPPCKPIRDFLELSVEEALLKGFPQHPERLTVEDPLLKGSPQHPERLTVEDPLLKGSPQLLRRLMVEEPLIPLILTLYRS